jgi:hypothetical protein
VDQVDPDPQYDRHAHAHQTWLSCCAHYAVHAVHEKSSASVRPPQNWVYPADRR